MSLRLPHCPWTMSFLHGIWFLAWEVVLEPTVQAPGCPVLAWSPADIPGGQKARMQPHPCFQAQGLGVLPHLNLARLKMWTSAPPRGFPWASRPVPRRPSAHRCPQQPGSCTQGWRGLRAAPGDGTSGGRAHLASFPRRRSHPGVAATWCCLLGVRSGWAGFPLF